MNVRPAKTQISLGFHQGWSESSLCNQWVPKDPSFLHVNNKDSDQTGQMPRLIWVFAGCICHFVGFIMRRLIFPWPSRYSITIKVTQGLWFIIYRFIKPPHRCLEVRNYLLGLDEGDIYCQDMSESAKSSCHNEYLNSGYTPCQMVTKMAVFHQWHNN